MKFYPQNCESENRRLIDSVEHEDCVTESETEADCWIAAKDQFGYELTEIQRRMLREKQAALVGVKK